MNKQRLLALALFFCFTCSLVSQNVSASDVPSAVETTLRYTGGISSGLTGGGYFTTSTDFYSNISRFYAGTYVSRSPSSSLPSGWSYRPNIYLDSSTSTFSSITCPSVDSVNRHASYSMTFPPKGYDLLSELYTSSSSSSYTGGWSLRSDECYNRFLFTSPGIPPASFTSFPSIVTSPSPPFLSFSSTHTHLNINAPDILFRFNLSSDLYAFLTNETGPHYLIYYYPSSVLLSVVSDDELVYTSVLRQSGSIPSCYTGSLDLTIPRPSTSLYLVFTPLLVSNSLTSSSSSSSPSPSFTFLFPSSLSISKATTITNSISFSWSVDFSGSAVPPYPNPDTDPSGFGLLYTLYTPKDPLDPDPVPTPGDNQDVLDALESMHVTQAQYHEEVMSAIDSMSEAQQATTDAIKDQTEENKKGFASIVDAITNLPQTIFDGLIHLFVPTEEDMQEIKEAYDDLLSEKLGLAYQAAEIIDNLFSTIVDNLKSSTPYDFQFPGVSFPYNDTTIVILNPMSVSLDNELMDVVRPVAGTVVIIVSVMSFVNMLKNFLESLLSGKSISDFEEGGS